MKLIQILILHGLGSEIFHLSKMMTKVFCAAYEIAKKSLYKMKFYKDLFPTIHKQQ